MATKLHLFFTALVNQIRFRLRLLGAWATTEPLTARGLRIALTLPRIAGGDGGDDADADDAAADAGDDAGGDKGDDDSNDADADDADDSADKADGANEPDWKRMARKHEREAKKARKEREDLAAKLKEREDADKSAQEKAVEQARTEAKQEMQAEHDKERRQDRLETATVKIAGRGLKIGTGDDAKTVRFADPDDALLHLERDIRNGDLDVEDIYDDNGRVKQDALTEALTDLLSRKPHLAESNGSRKVDGTADAGKGSASKTDTSVEDHFKKIRRHAESTPAQATQIGRRAG